MQLRSNIPGGPIEQKWDKHRFEMKLVNPANKRKFTVIVVGTGLAGGSAAATLTPEQRTQITRSFTSVTVRPVTAVNFSVAVGTVIPTTVELHEVPAEVVRVVPAYRGYRYFVVGNQIVIVEPSARRIVAVIERTG
jgi:hypothetical protein